MCVVKDGDSVIATLQTKSEVLGLADQWGGMATVGEEVEHTFQDVLQDLVRQWREGSVVVIRRPLGGEQVFS